MSTRVPSAIRKREKAYLKAISLAPKNPLAYNNLAWMDGGDATATPTRAVELASKAVELSPRSSPLQDTLGWAAARRRRPQPTPRSTSQA